MRTGPDQADSASSYPDTPEGHAAYNADLHELAEGLIAIQTVIDTTYDTTTDRTPDRADTSTPTKEA